eukprot:15350771-Alexandrium_andersonii.AAC.1
MARPDLLKCVCSLASCVNHWASTDSARLHGLMSYVAQSRELRLVGWCGDPPDDLEVRAYADADFASDRNTGRSTTGGV